MAKQTTNFGFLQPDANDFYNVQVQNENWNKLDELLGETLNNTSLTAHISDTNNPHKVTAAQTGAYYQDNINSLVEELEKSIKNGEVSTLQSAIQITSSTITNGEKFTGNGKGKLFISADSWTAPTSVIIDGKNIGAPTNTYQIGSVEIEFLKNFEVDSISGNTTKFYCVAVFY